MPAEMRVKKEPSRKGRGTRLPQNPTTHDPLYTLLGRAPSFFSKGSLKGVIPCQAGMKVLRNEAPPASLGRVL